MLVRRSSMIAGLALAADHATMMAEASMQTAEILAKLWSDASLPGECLGAAEFLGSDAVLPSSFDVTRAAAATIAASGLAAALLWRERAGRMQRVGVAYRHAAAAFHSEHFLRLDGDWAPRERGDIGGLYPTANGGWVRLHTNFPHHRAGILRLLGCEPTRDAVAAAMSQRDAFAFEDAAAAAGLPVTARRSFAEWDAHPQGKAVPSLPLVEIARIGDAPRPSWTEGASPLDGLRVLDLTRVIAGPVSTRTLAAHGAEVLTITGPSLPSYGIEDLGRGKRQAQLDLASADGRARMAELLREADVFVQGYRPGAIAAHGFSPEAAATLRPGVICASLSAYGAAGPWSGRRGFDSLVQTASGFNAAEAEAFGQSEPRPLPVQALDHGTGYLLAFGIMAALYRRSIEGGSWHVRVSLARTGHWLRGLGRRDDTLGLPAQERADVLDLLEASDSGFGRMEAIRPPALLSETPARLVRPSVPLGTHAPAWAALRS
jgi:crotonobetainyl-CoA:carnitine CoA-transferase CaiB-like acyl-CoA transferase